MSYSYQVHRKRLAALSFVLILILTYFGWAYSDPKPSTITLDLQISQNIYYNEVYEPYKNTSIEFILKSTVASGIEIIVAVAPVVRGVSEFNSTEYVSRSDEFGNQKKLLGTDVSVLYTFDLTLDHRVVVYCTDENSPSSISLDITYDKSAFAHTDAFKILNSFWIMLAFSCIFLFHKDLRYLWRILRSQILRKNIESRKSSDYGDTLDDLFGKRNNLEFKDSTKK